MRQSICKRNKIDLPSRSYYQMLVQVVKVDKHDRHVLTKPQRHRVHMCTMLVLVRWCVCAPFWSLCIRRNGHCKQFSPANICVAFPIVIVIRTTDEREATIKAILVDRKACSSTIYNVYVIYAHDNEHDVECHWCGCRWHWPVQSSWILSGIDDTPHILSVEYRFGKRSI